MGRDVTETRAAAVELNAIRRVATLVAKGIDPLALFAVVAEEVANVVDVPIVGIARYEPDGTATECASYSDAGPLRPLGRRWSLDGTSVLRLVRDTSRPVRIDDYSRLEGEIADTVRRSGIRSSAASPIVVEGNLWGVMVVSGRTRLPDGVEERLADFTELVATAIANADSRQAVEQLANEQAALRRIATLVAQGVAPSEIFMAVRSEVRRLFVTEVAAVARFDPNGGAAEVVGFAGAVPERWEIKEWMAVARVLRDGRSARADATAWASADDPAAARCRALGLVSTVASPIVVQGDLWGAMILGSTNQPLPLDTEERLRSFTELVATAIANAESRAELRASRRRIVTASDEARRRIERDLHDGTQQRMISLTLAARAASRAEEKPEELRRRLAEIGDGLADAARELQELSRGIHPGTLAHGGLESALRELFHRSPIPVAHEFALAAPVPEQVEIAAYFVVSEALANAAKHSGASRIDVLARTTDDLLVLAIDDDGVGGADPSLGSGFTGLHDRVEALGGSLRVRSRPGEGTQLLVELPLDQEASRPHGSERDARGAREALRSAGAT